MTAAAAGMLMLEGADILTLQSLQLPCDSHMWPMLTTYLVVNSFPAAANIMKATSGPQFNTLAAAQLCCVYNT